MKTTFARIKTDDNLEMDGLLYEPDIKTSKVLVHIHGMAGNFYENKFVDFLAKTITDNGIALAVFNNRGTEFFKDLRKFIDNDTTHVRIGSAYEKFEESPLDIKASINFAESKGFSEIHLSGHSLGSPKIVYYMYKQIDSRIKSILLFCPADMIGLAKQDKNYSRDISLAKEMVKEGKGKNLMPNLTWEFYPLSAETYLNLSEEGKDVGVLNFYDLDDKLPALASINIPIIAIMGRKDDAATLPLEDLMNRIKTCAISSPKIETKILGDADHAYKGYEQAMADIVSNWIINN